MIERVMENIIFSINGYERTPETQKFLIKIKCLTKIAKISYNITYKEINDGDKETK